MNLEQIAGSNSFNIEVMLARLLVRVNVAVPEDENTPMAPELPGLLQNVGVLSQAAAMRANAFKPAPGTNIFAGAKPRNSAGLRPLGGG